MQVKDGLCSGECSCWLLLLFVVVLNGSVGEGIDPYSVGMFSLVQASVATKPNIYNTGLTELLPALSCTFTSGLTEPQLSDDRQEHSVQRAGTEYEYNYTVSLWTMIIYIYFS